MCNMYLHIHLNTLSAVWTKHFLSPKRTTLEYIRAFDTVWHCLSSTVCSSSLPGYAVNKKIVWWICGITFSRPPGQSWALLCWRDVHISSACTCPALKQRRHPDACKQTRWKIIIYIFWLLFFFLLPIFSSFKTLWKILLKCFKEHKYVTHSEN